MRKMHELTKEKLQELGIVSVDWIKEDQDWEITRYWFSGKSKTEKKYTKRRGIITGQKHVYAPDGEYKIITFSAHSKLYNITLTRLVWAWYNYIVPEDCGVGFEDPNRADKYALDNLVLKTKDEMEKNKNKGNQYYSEKWNIVPKKAKKTNTVAECAKKINERYQEKICLLASEVVKNEKI